MLICLLSETRKRTIELNEPNTAPMKALVHWGQTAVTITKLVFWLIPKGGEGGMLAQLEWGMCRRGLVRSLEKRNVKEGVLRDKKGSLSSRMHFHGCIVAPRYFLQLGKFSVYHWVDHFIYFFRCVELESSRRGWKDALCEIVFQEVTTYWWHGYLIEIFMILLGHLSKFRLMQTYM